MDHQRTTPLLLCFAILVMTPGCDEDTAVGDDDTFSAPELSPCDEGSRQDPDVPAEFLDEFPDGCVPQACGIGRWGNLEVDGETVFVDVHAGEGGDGSEQAPFTSIQAGLDAAGNGGGTVAVAAGTYAENLTLTGDHDGVWLAGRCRELVVVDGGGGEGADSGLLALGQFMNGGEWGVSGLTVSNAPYVGIWIENGTFQLQRAAVSDNTFIGVTVLGSATEVSFEDVEVRDTRPNSDGRYGRGINIQEGARFEAEKCLVSRNAEMGIFAVSLGTEVILRDVEVRDTQPEADGTGGRGISVQDGPLLEADGCLVTGNADVGIIAIGDGAQVILRDVEVRDTQPETDGTGGRGIGIEDGARLEAEACLVEGNTELGIFATDDGSEVILHGVEVRDTSPTVDGTDGFGICVQAGARLEASDCLVEENSLSGLRASGVDTEMILRDVEVRTTRPLPDGLGGWGIDVLLGARVEAESCLVEENTHVGISMDHAGTEVLLREVEVRDTQALADGTFGQGMSVREGARLAAERCHVAGNKDVGIAVSGEGTEVVLQEVEVRDTKPQGDGTSGVGIGVAGGARLDARACLVGGNASTGILAYDAGTDVVLQEVEVRDTQSLKDGTGGRGIGIWGGARLEAEACVVAGNALMGIIASDEGTEMVLRDVEVSDTHRALPTTVAMGVTSQRDASLSAQDLTVTETEGPGLFSTSAGSLTCSSCELLGNTFAGALVWAGGFLHLSGTDIVGTAPDAAEGGGIGIYASDLTYTSCSQCGHAKLEVEGTFVEEQPYAALWLAGDGDYTIRNSTLFGGYGMELEYPDGTTTLQHGDAVVVTGGVAAWDGATGLLLEGNDIQDAVRAGVLLDASSASLSNNSFWGNTTDLIWQDCAGVNEPTGLETAPVVDYCPLYNHHIAPLEFSLYLEDGEPLDWQGAARSAAATAPGPLMPAKPSIPFIEPHPMIPFSTIRPLSTDPIRRDEPLPP